MMAMSMSMVRRFEHGEKAPERRPHNPEAELMRSSPPQITTANKLVS
jgi:hypothetical protein